MAVCFTDIQERELEHRLELIQLVKEQIRSGQVGESDVVAAVAFGVPTAVAALRLAFERVTDALGPGITDPVLREVADTLGVDPDIVFEWFGLPLDVEGGELVANPDAALLPASQLTGGGQPKRGRNAVNDLGTREKLFAAVVGILEREKAFPRESVAATGRLTAGDRLHFTQALRMAQGEFDTFGAIYTRALPRLVLEGEDGVIDRVRAYDWAGIVDTLRKDNVTAEAHYFDLRVSSALEGRNGTRGDGGPRSPGARPSWIDISLPDLESAANLDIVEDNLMAMQAIYFAATLDDLKLFQVMDKVLELFNVGVLPFGKGPAGDKIYTYWKRNFDRFTEVERQNLYARALGKPGGDVAAGTPNRQFQDLWLRFVASVSEWRRQLSVDRLLRDEVPFAVSDQQVRKSARDLASNLSLYGYGIAYFAATELQQQIEDIIDILSDPEVMAAYGARDLWQVIDQVATLELGGAHNGVRYRTMANSGAIIIRWLAKNSRALSQTGFRSVLQPTDVAPPLGGRPRNPLVDPTNFDLIEACEQYLAVTGTPDTRVEEFSQPSLGPDVTSRPIQIPSVARDLFESVGLNPDGAGLN